ncbi:hypothetical protein [Cellulomonas phragmiteti]|nr:hypothetical protein [Cellulomonas phragmiteti]
MSHTGRPGEPEPRPGATGPAHRPAATPQGAPAPAASGWSGWGTTDPAGAGAAPDPAAGGPDGPRGPGGDGPGGDGPDGTAREGRPAWLLPVAIGVGVLVVVGVVVGVLATRGGSDGDAPAPAASTVLVPPPTPGVEPATRTATSAFASVLPTTVLQYALESSQDDAEWVAAGALEAYTETFTDGDGGTLTVRAAQLETAQEATALLERLTAALPPTAPDTGAPTSTASAEDDAADQLPSTGDVMVAGAAVGTFTVVDAGDGTGIAVWQNGTAVFQLTAPLDDVVDAYAAYGL